MSGWKVTKIEDHGRYVHIHIKFKYALLNSSKDRAINKIVMGALLAAIDKSIKRVYDQKSFYEIRILRIKSGLDGYPACEYRDPVRHTFHMSTESRIISSSGERKQQDEHLLEIKKTEEFDPNTGAQTIDSDSRIEINETRVPEIIYGADIVKISPKLRSRMVKDRATIPHELGHTLGLEHVDTFWTYLFTFFKYKNQYMDSNMQKMNSTNMMMRGDGQYFKRDSSISLTNWQLHLIERHLKRCCYP